MTGHEQQRRSLVSQAGGALLDFWPSRGRWYSPATGEKGRAPDWWAALDQAQRSGVRMHVGGEAAR